MSFQTITRNPEKEVDTEHASSISSDPLNGARHEETNEANQEKEESSTVLPSERRGEVVAGSGVDRDSEVKAPRLPLIVKPGEAPPAHVGKWLTLTNEQYHADKAALSQSGAKAGAKSPAHFLAAWTAAPEPPTLPMRVGSLTHEGVFEPAKYARVIARPDFGDGRTKAAKDAKAAWDNERSADDVIVTATEKELIDGMVTSVRAHPLVAKLLGEGAAEQSGYWVDRETGILCRCRPDWIRTDGVVLDLKTTDDASPESFARTIVKWGYDIQAAHYLDGIEAITKAQAGPWIFVAVEKAPPYACAVYVADEAMIAHGRAERARIMRTIQRGIITGQWPAYSVDARTISLPTWALTSAEEIAQ